MHLGRQIPVGRGHEAHVYRDLTRAAQAPKRPGLEQLEHLGLKLGGQLPDLVEKDRPPIGQLDQSLSPLLRVGERAGLVPEQLRFEKRGRPPPRVDLDERAAGAW